MLATAQQLVLGQRQCRGVAREHQRIAFGQGHVLVRRSHAATAMPHADHAHPDGMQRQLRQRLAQALGTGRQRQAGQARLVTPGGGVVVGTVEVAKQQAARKYRRAYARMLEKLSA